MCINSCSSDFFFSSRRRHTRCALVTGVQTCALPIAEIAPFIRLVEAIEHEVEGETYKPSDLQVRAILDLRLHRLTALGRDETGNELQGLANNIAEYLAILGDSVKLYAVMREALEALRDEYETHRRSTIAPAADGIEDEDL